MAYKFLAAFCANTVPKYISPYSVIGIMHAPYLYGHYAHTDEFLDYPSTNAFNKITASYLDQLPDIVCRFHVRPKGSPRVKSFNNMPSDAEKSRIDDIIYLKFRL